MTPKATRPPGEMSAMVAVWAGVRLVRSRGWGSRYRRSTAIVAAESGRVTCGGRCCALVVWRLVEV